MTRDQLEKVVQQWAAGLDGEAPQDEDLDGLVDMLLMLQRNPEDFGFHDYHNK